MIGYDVVYDDGDRESGVAAELIRPIIRESSRCRPSRAAMAVEPAGEDDGVGICKSKTANWEAGIKVDGERMHLGTYDSPEAAARAYDEKAGARPPRELPARQRAAGQAAEAREDGASSITAAHFVRLAAGGGRRWPLGIWRAPGARKPTWKSSTGAGERSTSVPPSHLGGPNGDAKAREQGGQGDFQRGGEVKAEKNQRRARPAAAPSPRPPAPSPRPRGPSRPPRGSGAPAGFATRAVGVSWRIKVSAVGCSRSRRGRAAAAAATAPCRRTMATVAVISGLYGFIVAFAPLRGARAGGPGASSTASVLVQRPGILSPRARRSWAQQICRAASKREKKNGLAETPDMEEV